MDETLLFCMLLFFLMLAERGERGTTELLLPLLFADIHTVQFNSRLCRHLLMPFVFDSFGEGGSLEFFSGPTIGLADSAVLVPQPRRQTAEIACAWVALRTRQI